MTQGATVQENSLLLSILFQTPRPIHLPGSWQNKVYWDQLS